MNDGWKEDEKLVFYELKRLGDTIDSLKKDVQQDIKDSRKEFLDAVKCIKERINRTEVDVAALKVKATMLGLLAGTVPATIGLIIHLLTR